MKKKWRKKRVKECSKGRKRRVAGVKRGSERIMIHETKVE